MKGGIRMHKILLRAIRKVEMPKGRVNLTSEVAKTIGLTEQENTVLVTVYEDKIVITKEKRNND